MGSKLGSLIDNIKIVKPTTIMKKIKSRKNSLNPQTIFDFATQAIIKAKKISNNEVKVIMRTIHQVEHKTNTEIEKVMTIVVEKILDNSAQEKVSPEVKSEIVHLFAGYKKTKNLIPLLKYVNKVILENVPKNMKSAKSFKRNIAKTLINDANERLEGKKNNTRKSES